MFKYIMLKQKEVSIELKPTCAPEFMMIAKEMVVWIVPENLIKEVSKIMITFSKVSHCYQQHTFPDWPYNIFIMIHGEIKQECEKEVKEIAIVTNINDYKMLHSTDELNKVSMKHFME